VDAISGRIPVEGDLNTEGLDLPEGTYEKLFALDPEAWSVEADLTEEYFAKFGDKVPAELHTQLEQLRARIAAAREA